MDFRETFSLLEEKGKARRIDKEVDPHLEIAGVLNALDGTAVIFENVKNSDYRIAGNVVSDRDYFAWPLGIEKEQLIHTIADALDNPKEPDIVQNGPCQEVVEDEVDLDKIPFLTHLEKDGGPYVTSGVAIINDPDLGRNACYHRLMKRDKTSFAARIIPKRGTDTAFQKVDELEMAVCIGNSVPVLLGAALSPEKNVDELAIMNALGKTDLVKCKTKDLEVPADSEIILEGRLLHEKTTEGPFLDLTETWDYARDDQPVFQIDKITHRKDPIHHALLPGRNEHKLLMGMPREPTIFKEVNKVCECKNVSITLGGCSWLHAIVQIKKKKWFDGKRAIDAAFRGHNSLKHCVIIDDDINIYNPAEVEWAIATRFQADDDSIILRFQDGSSLDASGKYFEGDPKAKTAKMGLDATIPTLDEHNIQSFKKGKYQEVNLADYLE
ncbi:MAG: UbiD family decarboxylase [Candidatus Diapherotrites archaeon]|nr:UbiD family decarboxylase [Candidatus Diapherotrites archaeon]